jgi:uncharacterized membrane protein
VTSPPDPLNGLVAGHTASAPERRLPVTRGGHLSPRARKAALTAHIAVMAVWVGAVVANVFLAISAAATSNETLADAYYAAMDRLVNNLMPAAAIATLGTGLLLALATRWGLLRHWWILAKLALAVVTTLVGLLIIDNAIQDTIAERAERGSTGFSDALLPATAATPLLLLSAVTIAITKPWGRTARARRERRSPR